MYEELLNPPCWELNGRPDVTVVLSALFDLFDCSYNLVLECSSQTTEIKNKLSAISDRTCPSESVVCSTTLTGMRYEIPLGRSIPAELVDICEHHASPEYCDNCFVFHDGEPVLLWYDFGYENITIRPEIDRAIVDAIAQRTKMEILKHEE